MEMLRLSEVCELTRFKRTQVYALLAKNEFPEPYRLSPRRPVWERGQIENWIRERGPSSEPLGKLPKISAVGGTDVHAYIRKLETEFYRISEALNKLKAACTVPAE